MLIAALRRRVAALRQPASLARIAQVLWVAWAIILWNVVFDHVIVVAGREYLVAAVRSAHDAALSSPVNMDDWMRPAVTHGLWTATAAAAAVIVTGLASVRQAVRRSSSGNSVPR
jgi:CTP:molybdopterin cytidylyltransferase MocA